MPANQHLLTLLQISDLHFGDIDPVTGDASTSDALKKLHANTTWFDGLLGHHSRSLEHLARFWRDLRRQERHARVVITGDITRWGSSTELNNAADFLAARLELPVGLLGLRLGNWLDLAIPGNHDHWPGSPTIFGSADEGALPVLASGCPGVYPITVDGTTIQFIRIDTDADVSPFGSHRLCAIGSFQSQLAAVKTMLGRLPDYSVRVLLMHHSWHKKGLLRIADSSRDSLDAFLDEEDIHLMLSGHVHTPLIRKFRTTFERRQVMECRCGTTTQVDKMAYDARTIFGGFPVRRSWPSNSLLVHRLYRTETGLVWRAKTYVRLRKGFVDVGQSGAGELRIR